ncbi:MAG TPA: AI-2E family transporter [Kiritimatiellia bacterium]|nr:AI-2E family transporter [Kiritimatiellia bacterium]
MQILELGPRQRKVVATALTLLGAAVISGLVYYLFVLLARFVAAFSPVLTPLAVAGILALILRPYYVWLVQRVNWPWLAAVLVFASVLAPLVAASWFFGAMVAAQVRGLLEQLPVWIEAVSARVEAWMPQLNALWMEQGDAMKDQLRERGGWLAQQLLAVLRRVLTAGVNVFQVLGGLLSWVVLPVYLYFMLTARPISLNSLRQSLPFLKEETRDDVIYLAREFLNIMVAFFRGQFVIAAAMGVLFAIGFAFAGLQYGAAIGLTLGFLNIIPYLGNIIGLAVALPLAFFQVGGGVGLLVGVVGVFVAVQCIEAYFLTPRIMGQRTGLHPMAIIFALFFWGTALSGLLGMILGIPLTAFLVVFWRLLKAKYIREMI